GVEELHWLLGLVLDAPAEQKRAFDEALAARPKFALALYCRAGVRNAMQDREGAIRDYDEAVRASPGFAEAYLHRGSLHYGFGRAGPAFEDFDRLIRMKALLPGAYNGRGRVLAELMGKPAEALPDLDRAVELMPEGYILPWMARAKAHLQLRQYDRAIADATKALAIHRWADVYATRGLAREGKGDRAGAVEDLETALKGTTDPAPRKRLEEALDRLRR
ncbi:MAG TPA: tetratricopeptide repeat protein, partial [Planctomycetota bacterium]|nr:tetratricopeptide repeat protein [Planctomycetota bacterium]